MRDNHNSQFVQIEDLLVNDAEPSTSENKVTKKTDKRLKET